MINFDVDMSVDYTAMGFSEPGKTAKLTSYILDQACVGETEWKTRPAVIICPGGGYEMVCPREGEPIALKYNAAGFHAFVLDYSVAPVGWPAPCCELSKAVAYVRSIADKYRIDKNKIAVCGFSAGGHLAASIGVHYDKEIVKKYSGIKGCENRPDGLILSYPVITGNPDKTHTGTHDNFVAGRADAEHFFGLENFVNENTPKTFIWHTFTDQGVPVYNAMAFAAALMNSSVQYEMHIFPEGCHGLSLANKTTAISPEGDVPAVTPWIDLSITWLNNL